MKQKFRNKIPKGNLRTKYKIDGVVFYWETEASILIDQIITVVNYYESIDIKLTNRQLYYQLVGKNLIPNALEIYKRICTVITDLRYAGMIDWDSIEDKARKAKKPNDWDNLSSIINAAVDQYRLPRWDDQEYYVEMYCEKEAGINVLEPLSQTYHIHFGFNKGYSSAAALYLLAQRIEEKLQEDKKVIILYFGDHDPSGLDMIRDIKDRVSEFLEKRYAFEIISAALTKEQIEMYSLPPNPAKITDPRAKWYIKEFGKVSWELDAIDALELRKIAKKAILQYLDMVKYGKWIKREKKEIKALKNFGETLK